MRRLLTVSIIALSALTTGCLADTAPGIDAGMFDLECVSDCDEPSSEPDPETASEPERDPAPCDLESPAGACEGIDLLECDIVVCDLAVRAAAHTSYAACVVASCDDTECKRNAALAECVGECLGNAATLALDLACDPLALESTDTALGFCPEFCEASVG